MESAELTLIKSNKKLKMKHLEQSPLWKDISMYANSSITSPWQLLFHYENKLLENPKCQCGNSLNWHPDKRQYRKYCSKKCTGVYSIDQVKQNNMQIYGVEWPSQLSEWRAKVKQTSINKYGVDHYSKTEEFLMSVKNTNIKKYGAEYPAQSIDIQEKIINSWIEKYGVNNIAQNEQIKNKIKNTNAKKYGVENVLSSPEIKNKIRNTNQLKYGVSHAMKNKDISLKAGNQRKENYYDKEILDKLNDKSWLHEQNSNGLTVNEIAVSLGVSSSNLCKYFHKHGIDIQYHGKSAIERKIFNYYTNLNIPVMLGDRSILIGKEIDIYFPSYSFGIEINGGYWHSEEYGKDRLYHLNKTVAAQQQQIELWHFWDWEVNNSWECLIGKINHKIGISQRLMARKLELRVINSKEKTEFLIRSHIQQDCISKINLGLFDNNNLVMVATFGASRFSKKHNWELLRMATLPGVSVSGGASKLLTYFEKNYMCPGDKLISFSDRRFGNGDVYTKIGFTKSHTTSPGYVYVKNGVYAGSRNRWQKHKLPILLPVFDPNLTEMENMMANGYYRAWDCGQQVFEYNTKNSCIIL